MPDLHDLLDRRAKTLRPQPLPAAFDRAMRRADRRHRNRRLSAGLLAFALFAGAGAGLWTAFQPGPPKRPPASIPMPGEVTTIPLPATPSDLALAPDGTVWATLPHALARIDPDTGAVHVERDSPLELAPTGIAITETLVGNPGSPLVTAWMSNSNGTVDWVTLHDPLAAVDLSACCGSIDVGGPATGVAAAGGLIWATVTHGSSGAVVEIDPDSQSVVERIPLPSAPSDIVPLGDSVAVALQDPEAEIATVEPGTGAVRVLHRFIEMVPTNGSGVTGVTATRIATSGQEVWGSWGDTVARVPGDAYATLAILSPAPSGSPPSPPPGPSARVPGAGALTIDGGQVWVVANDDSGGLLYEIDRATGEIVGAPTPVGPNPVAVGTDSGTVWVANAGDQSVSRVQLQCGDGPCGAHTTQPLPTTEDGTTIPLPGTTSTIALPSAPTAMAAAPDGSILVTTGTSLFRVDSATNSLERLFHEANADLSGVAVVSYRTPAYPEDFVFAWLSDRAGVARWVLLHAPSAFLAQASMACCGSVDLGGPALGVAVDAGSVWVTVAHEGPGDLVRIDPRTNEITGRFPTGDGPATVSVGEGGVWVRVTSGNARLQRFDPTTGELVGEQGGDWFVAATADEAWASGSDTVQRIMPTTTVTVPIISPEPSGGLPGPSPDPSAHVPGAGPMTISGDQVWAVANTDPERTALLYEIDRRTGDILGQPTEVGMTPTAVAVAEGSVWVANFNDPSVTRVQLLCGGSPCAGPLPPASPPSGETTSGPPTTGTEGNGELAEPPLPFLVGKALVGEALPPVTLRSVPDGRIAGLLSPVAAFVDDHTLLYSTWTNMGGGGVMAHDLETGREHPIRAVTFAVRQDGAVATSNWATGDVVSNLPEYGIWVSPTVSTAGMGDGEQWLSGQNLIVVGWAGSTLLAVRTGAGDSPIDVLALDGPGQVRTLAQSASIVAISPDGTKVLLAERPRPPERQLAALVVVDPLNGRTLAEAPLPSLIDPERGQPIGLVEGQGDWAEDTVVAPSATGTVLIRVTDASIDLRQQVVIDSFPPLNEPQFIEGDPNRFIGWVATPESPSGPDHPFWVEVDVSPNGSAEVRIGPQGGTEPVRPVRSLSRPAA